MANKRRPRKTKAPYKHYGPGGMTHVTISRASGITGLATTNDDEEEDDELEMNGYVGASSLGGKRHPVMKGKFGGAVTRGDMLEIPVEFDDKGNAIRVGKNEPVFPPEIVLLIMRFCDDKRLELLRVCKLWYALYLSVIYEDPVLDSYNFNGFVESIGQTKSKLGSLVKRLDLSTIIQSGKNSFVSKVLRRCSSSLEIFVAPQTSFGYAPLISLRGCRKIKVLDLGLVSETVNLNHLFHAISNARELTHLSFPRSSIECEDFLSIQWPEKLEYLRISGGITDAFMSESTFPATITNLSFAHCPVLKDLAMYSMLSKFGEGLKYLSIQYPMPRLNESSMDFIFTYCPNLTFLQITVDYCSRFLFGEELLPPLEGRDRPLRTLWIESSGGLGQASKIHPDDLTIAIMEERLPCLKNVRVTPKLGWDFKSEDVEVLVDLLEENGGGLYSSNF